MIMSMRHRDLPVHSVQFHPESVMTEHGHRILANWLAVAGRPVDEAQIAALEARHAEAQQATAAVLS
jgi:para-aminobenzoate synthetase component 2